VAALPVGPTLPFSWHVAFSSSEAPLSPALYGPVPLPTRPTRGVA
jgi:hypothetical protein